MPSKGHQTCERLVRIASRELKKCEFPTKKKYWLERDLQDSMFREALRASGRHGVASAKTGFRAPIPNWWPAAGDVDLVVEAAMASERRFDLYELKWCNHNRVEEALWDAVKLLNAHGLPEVRHTYLVFGAPLRWWRQEVVGARCFDPAETSTLEILGEHEERWRAVVKGGTGRPKRVPETIAIERVVTSELDISATPYEIRAVAIRPVGRSMIDL